MRRASLWWMLLASGCAESEAERESKAMEAATPKRLQGDGSVLLSNADRLALGVEVAAAEAGTLAAASLHFGRVLAQLDDEALVVAPITGRVTDAPAVALGETVTVGAVILELTPQLTAGEHIAVGVQRSDVAGQIAALTQELGARDAELVRARELAEFSIISAQQLKLAETAVATTRSRIGALQRARGVQIHGEAAEQALTAPIAGVVTSLAASRGSLVRAGDVVARVVASDRPRWVDVRVAPEEPVGATYEVSIGSSWIAARLVTRGAMVGDDGARHDRLEIEAGVAAAFLPGATVTVRVREADSPGVVVPESAIVPGVGTDHVFVEAPPGRFVARAVTVATRHAGTVRLAGGLEVGEKVVTRGAMALHGEGLRGQLRHSE